MRIKGNGYLHRQFVVLVTLVVIVSVLAACSRSEPPATSPVAGSGLRPTVAAVATPPASGGAIKLNGNLPEGGNVSEQYQVSANGSHVVYIADAGTNDIDELYSVPLAGGPVVKLNLTLEERQKVSRFLISPDGKRVVFLVAAASDRALYSVPITGGTPVKLTLPLFESNLVKAVTISPDSSRVVYYTRFQDDEGAEIYSAPVAGGAPVRLSHQATENSPMVTWGDFKLSADGKWVVFTEDKMLYRVPVAGGTPVRLTENGVMVEHFQISPDSSFVVYTTGGSFYEPPVLHRVPVAGGAATKLSGAFTDGPRNEGSFQISPNSRYVVFTAVPNGQSQELFSISLDSPGNVVKLNHTLVAPQAVISYTLSPDSRYVAYTATWGQQQMNYDLYSVPVAGGAPERLNRVQAQNFPRHVLRFAFSPNSSRIVYSCSCEDGLMNLYSVPVAGSETAAVRINTPKHKDSGGTKSFTISPDSSQVVYIEYEQIPTYLYSGREWWVMSTPLAGGGQARLVSGPVARSFVISPDSKQVVYQYSKRSPESNLDTWNLYVSIIAPK